MGFSVHVYHFRKPAPKETTPTNTDTESPPTPTKASRQTRARNGKAILIQQSLPQASESDDDAEEVASELGASQWSTPEAVTPAPSSDDFGGYSDDE
jgi:hypothetical protein